MQIYHVKVISYLTDNLCLYGSFTMTYIKFMRVTNCIIWWYTCLQSKKLHFE